MYKKRKPEQKLYVVQRDAFYGVSFFSYKNEPLFRKNDILKEKRRL